MQTGAQASRADPCRAAAYTILSAPSNAHLMFIVLPQLARFEKLKFPVQQASQQHQAVSILQTGLRTFLATPAEIAAAAGALPWAMHERLRCAFVLHQAQTVSCSHALVAASTCSLQQ